MSDPANSISPGSVLQTPTDAVHVLMRFVRLLRANLLSVAICTLLSGAVGLGYYLTAQPIYEAYASLLVESAGADGWNVNVTGTQSADSLIPTQELLITKAVVLNKAAEELRESPAHLLVDFRDVPFEKWPDVIRKNLKAQGYRRTQIIELRYRSLSPEGAEAVLAAVVDSYMAFTAENHRNASVEMVKNLDVERRDIEKRLEQKQNEWCAMTVILSD